MTQLNIKAKITHKDFYRGQEWFILQDDSGFNYGASYEAVALKKGILPKLWVGKQVVIKQVYDTKYSKIAKEIQA